MKPEQLSQLAQRGYNRIPVVREVLTDLDTPVSAYLKLADAPYSYLFESVQGGEKWGRYSIIGLPAREVVRVCGHQITVESEDTLILQEEVEDPLTWIESFQSRYRVAELDDLPRFTGGLVGYFGFDTIRYIEPRLAHGADGKSDPIGNPDIMLLVSEEVVVFDNLSGKLSCIVHVDPNDLRGYEKAEQRLSVLSRYLHEARAEYQTQIAVRQIVESDFESSFTREGYEAAVKRIREYIIQGDVMQVVPSQRMSIPFSAKPFDLYRALRQLNPSPYMYYLNLKDFHIVGSSPEILARLEGGEVTVRPIAGTRPRGRTRVEDSTLEAELLSDPKELAEHLMLIDLGRNDVGKVSQVGTVDVSEQMSIERYSHVMHIVSHVTGRLRPELTAMDVLRATFPAGTVSGAPKIRALEIIDELEPVRRGVYSGAVGYIAWNGNMDTAIAIRTAVIKDNTLHIQAGGGIVYDSIPAVEWEETLNKRRAMFRAVALSEAGLDVSLVKE